MKTIKQTLLGFALSVISITAVAQCPTAVSLTVTSNPSNGNLTVATYPSTIPRPNLNNITD